MYRSHATPILALVGSLGLVGTEPGMAQADANAAYPPRAGRYESAVERNVMVPMRDGVRLATDVYRPRGLEGPLPTVLIRTPYDKPGLGASPGSAANVFASHGYAVAVQDVRGKFASEGEFRIYNGDTTDWPDMFSWLARQPWSNGKVGTYGCSYLGEGQILAAQERHPNHIAAIPQAAGGNLGRVPGKRLYWGSVEGGAFALSINFGWMPIYGSLDKGRRARAPVDFATHLKTLPVIDMAERVGSPSWDWRNFLERSPDDPWWDARGYLTEHDSVSTAALHVTSWYDLAGEALAEAEIFRKNATNARAREGQYVIVAPTVHCAFGRATNPTVVGQLDVGDARLDYWDIYLNWFDHWLKGESNDVLSMPKFQYYTFGRNQWRGSPTWPVAGMRETPIYLDSDGHANSSRGDGRLVWAAPSRERVDTFTYDPANPMPARGGSVCCTGNPKDQPGAFDQSDLEERPDMLVYTSERLSDGLEITGAVRARIFLSSDARDTDVTVKLIDLFPDGRAINIVEGITRARYREGFDRKVWMEPGAVYQVPVDLHATSWYLAPGHRLRVEVASSNFPRYDRNLNTGGNNYDETAWVKARNGIHHSRRYPSRIELPVVR